MSSLKISLVQYPTDNFISFDQFIEKHDAWIEKAAAEKPDLLIFPELASLDLVDFKSPLDHQWETIGTGLAEKYFSYIKSQAQKRGFWILGSSFPVKKFDGFYNVAPLYSPQGFEVLQDKIFLTPEEKNEWRWHSGHELHTFYFKGAKTCILICHDSEFPVISQKLSEIQPEILLVPSMTGDQAGVHRVRWCSQSRAIEHHCFAVVTGITDEGPGTREYVGQAALCTPQNPYFPTEVALGPLNKEALISYTLDMDLLKKTRADRDLVFPTRDQLARDLEQLKIIKKER